MNDEKMMEILRDVVLVVDVECIILTPILDFFVFDAVWQAISSVAILMLSVITLVFDAILKDKKGIAIRSFWCIAWMALFVARLLKI